MNEKTHHEELQDLQRREALVARGMPPPAPLCVGRGRHRTFGLYETTNKPLFFVTYCYRALLLPALITTVRISTVRSI